MAKIKKYTIDEDIPKGLLKIFERDNINPYFGYNNPRTNLF